MTFPSTIWRIARIPLIAYLTVLLLMTFIERWLVYPVPSVDTGDWLLEGIDYEDAWFASQDGTRLHGWFAPHPEPKQFILYCHGNGEDVSDSVDFLGFLRDRLDASVLIFDYRGYGRSDGTPHEEGIIADGLAAQHWLSERVDRNPNQTVVMGRSIGGAVAIAIAAENGAKALVLESTFSRLTDAASHHYPWLPVRLLMRNRYDSIARIKRYQGPVFQSHGTADQVVPIAVGRRLFDELVAANRVFYEIPGGGHNDGQPCAYYDILVDFLAENGSPAE